MTDPEKRRPSSWPLALLALPAFVAVWSGWVGLGAMTGFGVIHPLPGTPLADWSLDTAITLPIGVETYAAYALRVWLSGACTPAATRFAQVSSLGALMVGAAGQLAYHLMTAAGVAKAPWWITAVVATLPVVVLGMGAALAHLVNQNTPDQAQVTDIVAVADAGRPALTDDGMSDTSPAEMSDIGADTSPAEMSDTNPDTSPDIGRAASRTKPSRKRPTTAERIARLRERHPDLSVSDIARRLKITERTVHRHVAAGRLDPALSDTSTDIGVLDPHPADTVSA